MLKIIHGEREAIIPGALGSCPPQAWQVPATAAGEGREEAASPGPTPVCASRAGQASTSEQPLHRAGLTNSSALLMTHRDCGDTGRARQTDGQQLLRRAVLAPALERFLAAPLSSRSYSPGLMLMAEFVGSAMS